MPERYEVERVPAHCVQAGDTVIVQAVDATVRKVEKYEGTPDRQLHFVGRLVPVKALDNEPMLRVVAARGGTEDGPAPSREDLLDLIVGYCEHLGYVPAALGSHALLGTERLTLPVRLAEQSAGGAEDELCEAIREFLLGEWATTDLAEAESRGGMVPDYERPLFAALAARAASTPEEGA